MRELLVRPTERQLQKAQDDSPACAAYNQVRRAIPIPDFLVLQHKEPAKDFVLHIAGARPLKLEAALRLITFLHSSTKSFGKLSSFVEQAQSDGSLLGISKDGMRMACVDDFIIVLSEGDTLPAGIARLQKIFEVTDTTTSSKLTLSHFVRIVIEDGTYKIAEWWISNQPGDFIDRLR